MTGMATRATVYLAPGLHRALRLKAARTRHSISRLVNEAVRRALQADQEDLAALDARAHEPTLSYEALLKDLKKHGKLLARRRDVYRDR